MNILHRKWIEVNTDPQRRCYASSEWMWTAWRLLELEIPPERVEARLEFWRDLNDYAVSQRGQSAKCEFKAVEEEQL